MKIKYYKYVSVFLLSLGLLSCDNFLDVNESPNNVQEEDINPRLTLPGALANSYRVQARTMNTLGNIFMQNWGGDVNNFTGANTDEYALTIDSSFYDDIWDGLYPAMYGFQKIVTFDSTEYDNHKAVAYIMKSFYMQYIVDLYGDAPYSQAWQGQNNLAPAYDDDMAIYRDLIVNIDRALVLFEEADTDDEPLGVADIVFEGDVASWIKFANTLKIRILLRQSELAQVDAATESYLVTEFAKVEALGQYLDVHASINPGYTDEAAAQLNPFYSQFKTATGADVQFNNFTRATAYVADFLNGTANGVADPRADEIYALVDGVVSGAVQGEITGPDPMSQVGPGLIRSADQDGYIMTISEAKFLLAEAIERGYLPGNAQQEFEDGIRASFFILALNDDPTMLPTDPLSVDQIAALNGEVDAYIGAANAVPGLGWNGDHIQSIMTQKWVALNGFNAIESWIDYTRTGFPDVPLATTAQYPNRPYRLIYPTSELVSNSSNVPTFPIAQAFTQGPFWKI